jgi:hypothetical protein
MDENAETSPHTCKEPTPLYTLHAAKACTVEATVLKPSPPEGDVLISPVTTMEVVDVTSETASADV